ncbi:MAG: DMT family transporter [Dongiaceae bacterium]
MTPEMPPAQRAKLTPLFRYVIGPLCLLAMGLGWSGSYTLAKIATMRGGSPFGLAIWEGLGSGLLLLILCAFTGRWPRFNRQYLIYYTVNGLIGLSLPSIILLFVSPHLPVSITTLLIPLAPVVTYVIVLLLRIEPFVVLRAAGILVGFGGVLLIVLPENSLPDPSMAGWVLIGLLASVLYASQNVYIATKCPPGADALSQTAAMLFIGGVIIMPFAWIFDGFTSFLPPWDIITACGAGMMIVNAFFTITFVWTIQVASPVFASQTAYTITLCGSLWGWLLFGELHSIWIWGALVAMIAGVALVTLVQPNRKADGGKLAGTGPLPSDQRIG